MTDDTFLQNDNVISIGLARDWCHLKAYITEGLWVEIWGLQKDRIVFVSTDKMDELIALLQSAKKILLEQKKKKENKDGK